MDVLYPRIGELTTLYHEQELHLDEQLDVITSRRHPLHIEGLNLRPGGIRLYQFWPQMTTVNAHVDDNEVDWNLWHEMTRYVLSRDALLRGREGNPIKTWNRFWIDITMVGVAETLAHMIVGWFGDQPGYDGLLMDGFVHRIWSGWYGNQARPEDPLFDVKWAQATYAMQRIFEENDLPIVAGGDKLMPWMGHYNGVKLEDWLVRETDWYDEAYLKDDQDNRNYYQAHRWCRKGSMWTLCDIGDLYYPTSMAASPAMRFKMASCMLFDGVFIWPSGSPQIGQSRIEALRRWFPMRWRAVGNYQREETSKATRFSRRFESDDGDGKAHTIRETPATGEVTGL